MLSEEMVLKIKSQSQDNTQENLECKNLEKRLKKKVIGAIKDFNMIDGEETILLGVSGGKDSMLLGYLLNEVRKTAKDKFNIRGIYIFKDFLINCDIMFEEKRKYFEEVLGIPLEKVNININPGSKLSEGIGKSCQRCAYARRIALMKLCAKYGATKIAYGHHMDDIVVTSFMNMISGKKLKVMPPMNRMSGGDIAFIRPLAYIRESEIMRLVTARGIPFSGCNCPVGEDKTRNRIKRQIVRENEKIFPKFVENTFRALIKDFQEKYEKIDYKM